MKKRTLTTRFTQIPTYAILHVEKWSVFLVVFISLFSSIHVKAFTDSTTSEPLDIPKGKIYIKGDAFITNSDQLTNVEEIVYIKQSSSVGAKTNSKRKEDLKKPRKAKTKETTIVSRNLFLPAEKSNSQMTWLQQCKCPITAPSVFQLAAAIRNKTIDSDKILFEQCVELKFNYSKVLIFNQNKSSFSIRPPPTYFFI